MKPQVVILSHRKDEHALAVLTSLSTSTQPFLLDIGKTGKDFVVSRDAQGTLEIFTKAGNTIRFDETAFWWNRRPRVESFQNTPIRFALAQEVETEEFWSGTLCCELPGLWCNPFEAQRRAQQKIPQIEVARNSGLRVPDTIWTNDPSAIREFAERHSEGIVFKMFSGTEAVWQPCRFFDEDLSKKIAHARFMPAIFQEYISGSAEYRITIFGEYAFSARADISKSRYPSDVRIDLSLRREVAKIDPALERNLREFMRIYRLSFATFDIREDRFGEPIFLECNPMGQFLYLDHIYSGKILRSFCSFAESAITLPREVSNLCAERIHSNRPFDDEVTVPIYEAAGSWTRHIE